MRMNAYSVYDYKTGAYHLPFFAINDGVAVRTLSDAVADPNMMFGRHPKDYVLYCVGQFDDQAAQLIPMSPIKHVIEIITILQSLQSEIPFPDRLASEAFKANGTKRGDEEAI